MGASRQVRRAQARRVAKVHTAPEFNGPGSAAGPVYGPLPAGLREALGRLQEAQARFQQAATRAGLAREAVEALEALQHLRGPLADDEAELYDAAVEYRNDAIAQHAIRALELLDALDEAQEAQDSRIVEPPPLVVAPAE